MRTTLRIDDDLLDTLKHQAELEDLSLTQLVNRLLRLALRTPRPRKRLFRQATFVMGREQVDLNCALDLAAKLEDEEIIRKLNLRK